VILNRVASARQEALIVPAVERAGFPVLGCIGRNDDLTLPERHLGLVQASETDDLEARLDAIADAVEAGVRIFDLVALAAPAFRSADNAAIGARPALDPPGQRIGLAQDHAFAFMYPHIISGWRARGAEIVAFSPLADEPPDPQSDAVWLPGGYPELHGGYLEPFELERGVAPPHVAFVALERRRVGARERRSDGRARPLRLDQHEPPWLAVADGGRMAREIDQRGNT
jgi:cobyrinic acid a,c-diamide synthase